jgi:hypothetical protein
MDTRRLRPDFKPQLVEYQLRQVEVGQEELLYLPPFAEEPEAWLGSRRADVSWLELMFYWIGELSWWRSYWNHKRD